MRKLFSLTFLFLTISIYAQDPSWFYEMHDQYKETALYDRFFKYTEVEPLILDLQDHPDFEVSLEGQSVQGRNIYLLKWGHGPEVIYMWTQMHGDEPTATMAVADIWNFLSSEEQTGFKEELAEKVTLLFLPFLNPDGAEVFKRRNALDVDLNRDALRLQSPESRILKDIRDRYNPSFGFNLHDQSLYYGAGHTGVPVAIAFLAPAYNMEREVNEVRLNAMKLIAQLNEIVQEYVPGKVAKFNDAFEPRAFGDNMQRWGTSTVLIESGGLLDDPEKQYLRKLHFVMLMSAIVSIANGDYQHYSREAYEEIPANRISIFDLLIKNGVVSLPEGDFILDLGFRSTAVFSDGHQGQRQTGARLVDVGDLSTFGGYRVYDAEGYYIVHAAIWPEIFSTLESLLSSDWREKLKTGYGYFHLEEEIPSDVKAELPFLILQPGMERPSFPAIGYDAALFMQKDGEIRYVIANGAMHSIQQ
ncbi:MAG: peptidase M14 [Saprospirales bacterium]|nr:MAG: peptidase M14 [Saprospirales bacterium]